MVESEHSRQMYSGSYSYKKQNQLASSIAATDRNNCSDILMNHTKLLSSLFSAVTLQTYGSNQPSRIASHSPVNPISFKAHSENS